MREADERMLEVFDNDSICRILHVRCRDCLQCVEQVYQHCSCKESFAGLVMLQDVTTVNWTDFRPRRLARGAGEFAASLRRGQQRSRPTWNRSLDRKSSTTRDGERAG